MSFNDEEKVVNAALLDKYGNPIYDNNDALNLVPLSIKLGDMLKIDHESKSWWEVLNIDVFKSSVHVRRSHKIISQGLQNSLLQFQDSSEDPDYLLKIKEEREIPEWVTFQMLEKKEAFVRRELKITENKEEISSAGQQKYIVFKFAQQDAKVAMMALEDFLQADIRKHKEEAKKNKEAAWQAARSWLESRIEDSTNKVRSKTQKLHLDRCNDYRQWLRVGKSLFDFQQHIQEFRFKARGILEKMGVEVREKEIPIRKTALGDVDVLMLKKAFKWYDQKKEGKITWSELCATLSEMRCEFEPADAIRWIKEHRSTLNEKSSLDAGKGTARHQKADGTVEFNDFLNWCSSRASHLM